jgi:hypothetical protein
MRITSYGLFWHASEVNWSPGKGKKNEFNVLGKVGSNKGKIKVADFRLQQGIYILYDDYGPAYTGLTRASYGLGKRIKDHTQDHLARKWDRFCWFGFKDLAKKPNAKGVFELIDLGSSVEENTHTTIGDLETLLIQLLGTKLNKSKMKFEQAQRWEQIPYDDRDYWLEKVKPK